MIRRTALQNTDPIALTVKDCVALLQALDERCLNYPRIIPCLLSVTSNLLRLSLAGSAG